jgi:Uma2 family endonuclease
MLTAEEITENFNQFRDLLSKIGDRSESALKLVDHFGERLALCPASSKRSYHNSFAGGLVDHSLRVCKNAVVMMKSYCEQSYARLGNGHESRNRSTCGRRKS